MIRKKLFYIVSAVSVNLTDQRLTIYNTMEVPQDEFPYSNSFLFYFVYRVYCDVRKHLSVFSLSLPLSNMYPLRLRSVINTV